MEKCKTASVSKLMTVSKAQINKQVKKFSLYTHTIDYTLIQERIVPNSKILNIQPRQ